MLYHLRVKNLALIDTAEVEFGEGLNILTGETGAGKSIVIGSVNVALGGKASRELIRQGCDSALVELLFLIDDEEKKKQLLEYDVSPDEDGLLIISKKITPSRSISRVNDETVTAARLREITGLLIDLHGQHEHQSLLHHARHLEILDEYAASRLSGLKQNIALQYRLYMDLNRERERFETDQEQRIREMDFCRFEIEEIEAAKLLPGEEEALSQAFRRLSHGKKIAQSLLEAREAVGAEGISRAIRSVESVAPYDEGLSGIRDELYDLEAMLGDLERDLDAYLNGLEVDEETLIRTEERLDLIRGLEHKYGKTIPDVLKSLEEKKERLMELEHFDELREETERKLEIAREQLLESCHQLTKVRREVAEELTGKIQAGLRDLNFLDVRFTMEFRALDHVTANGMDEAEFLISTNPGEPERPLGMVASGGELSRIMLAIKTVLAETDQIPTLIFDEIDAGISGRTAQMVSEKLRIIAKRRQVICITHLPQIAAMADRHFEIRKTVSEGRTATSVRPLGREEMVEELSRLLGGAQITEAVRRNAWEMKELADRKKEGKHGTESQ